MSANGAIEIDHVGKFQGLEHVFYLSVRYVGVFFPLLVILGIKAGGWFSFVGAFIIFGFCNLVSIALKTFHFGTRFSEKDEFRFTKLETSPFWRDGSVSLYLVLQIAMIFYLVFRLMSHSLTHLEVVGSVFSCALSVGTVGGIASHELYHKREKWKRALGIAGLASIFYSHFYVSHTRGHHRTACLPGDWSTAKLNESCYSFLCRAIVMGYIGAWKLESVRLKKQGRSVLSLQNFMVASGIFHFLVLTTIVYFSNISVALLYVFMSLLSAIYIEMINYHSHYGLVRKKLENGNFEPFQSKHSWESNDKVTNWLIFNAGKHTHHHRVPSANYTEMKFSGEKLYLPCGLLLQTLVAFIPPLYFHMMAKHLPVTDEQGIRLQ